MIKYTRSPDTHWHSHLLPWSPCRTPLDRDYLDHLKTSSQRSLKVRSSNDRSGDSNSHILDTVKQKSQNVGRPIHFTGCWVPTMVSFSKSFLFALLLARHCSLATSTQNADEVASTQNGNDKKRQVLQEDEGYWNRFVMEVNDMSLPSAEPSIGLPIISTPSSPEPSPASSPAPSPTPTPVGGCLVLVSPLKT